MNSKMQTKFEERLNQIIGAEGSIEEALDELDNEDGKPNLPVVVEYDEVESRVEESEALPPDLLEDYKFSRKILYGLINRGTVALEGSLIVARESEHPRAYEVSASIMKNISEMTKDLLELQKSLQPAHKQTIGKQVNVQQNFNGTTPEGNSIKDINAMLDDL